MNCRAVLFLFFGLVAAVPAPTPAVRLQRAGIGQYVLWGTVCALGAIVAYQLYKKAVAGHEAVPVPGLQDAADRSNPVFDGYDPEDMFHWRHILPVDEIAHLKTRIMSLHGDIIDVAKSMECWTRGPWAIVNAANDQLAGGGGVCGAIFEAAGRADLQVACNQFPLCAGVRCPVGQVRITDSFGLKARGVSHIIHAVGPDCRVVIDQAERDRLLANAYISALELADKNGITSIAFPAISTGIYGFPAQKAYRVALDAVCSYLKNRNSKIQNICFVFFSFGDFASFDMFAAFQKHKHGKACG